MERSKLRYPNNLTMDESIGFPTDVILNEDSQPESDA